MNDNYTIKEAARVYELNINTLYKYIQQGKINAQCHTIKGKKIKKITKSDIERFLGINCEVKSNKIQKDTITDNQQNTIKSNGFKQNPITDNLLTKDNLKEVFKDFIEEQKAEWIKPLEEHALVKYGALSTENKFLKDRLETVIEENNVLREAMKFLPGPVEEIKEKLLQQETFITDLQTELQVKEEEKEEAIEVLKQETAQVIQNVELEKSQIILEKEKTLQQIQKEKEELEKQKDREIAELAAAKEKELQELKEQKERAEKEEQDLLATLEAMKQRLEEEQKRPWWKKIFG